MSSLGSSDLSINGTGIIYKLNVYESIFIHNKRHLILSFSSQVTVSLFQPCNSDRKSLQLLVPCKNCNDA